jgi:SAP domain-containing ribonucleoprotein
MSDYSSKTVPQLKDILKQKNLSIDGKKADLIQRLVEFDSQNNDPVVPEPESEAPAAETTEQPANSIEESAPADAENDSTLTVIQPKDDEPTQPPPPKVLSPEERKSLAVELLNKKIARAEKFGDDQAAETAKKDLVRVEKFGVEPGTALAKEIGVVDSSLPNGRRFHKKFHHKSHRKNFKPKNRGRERRRS